MKQFNFPAPNEPSQRASAFFDAISDKLSYLHSRWLDEHRYEDIREYQVPLDSTAAEYGVKIVKMNKRPFGFDFECDGRTYVVKASLKANEYRRIK